MLNSGFDSRRRGRLEKALAWGLRRAYARVQVNPEAYLRQVQRAHRLPIRSWEDMFALPQETVDRVAQQVVSGSMRMAAAEGAGLGIGGLVTLVPDMGILSAIVVRMLQRLSLVHGFAYATEEETAALWLAAASAAGLDMGREILEREAIGRAVPRVIEKIAARASAEVCEKWAARVMPVVSGALGSALNYYFVREWGRRATKHFREKHVEARSANSPGAQDTRVQRISASSQLRQ